MEYDFVDACFNGATLRTRGIRVKAVAGIVGRIASMGPRLGRVEYGRGFVEFTGPTIRFNGATLRTRGILHPSRVATHPTKASMGPRFGRVEYGSGFENADDANDGFNGATLRTRGILRRRKGCS